MQFGMIPIVKCKFNDYFAPSDWNYDRDKRPDIIFLAYSDNNIQRIFENQRKNIYKSYDWFKNIIPYMDNYNQCCNYLDNILSGSNIGKYLDNYKKIHKKSLNDSGEGDSRDGR